VDVARPYRLLSHPLDGAVLGVLAATNRPLSGREVARLAPEGSTPGVWKALSRLTEQGLLDREEAGNALLYSLNREHVAAPAAELLTSLRAALIDRLSRHVQGWEVGPAHLSIFGSLARGDGDASSDVDVFVVRPKPTNADDAQWRAQLDDLATAVRRWSGNRAGISEVAEADIARLARERPPIVEQIACDAITLAGPDAGSLFRDGDR
jgi:predicted nucleotidyltransferase